MSTIDECLEQCTPEVREAIERICDRAGTYDADWNVLKAAAELLVEAESDRELVDSYAETQVNIQGIIESYERRKTGVFIAMLAVIVAECSVIVYGLVAWSRLPHGGL